MPASSASAPISLPPNWCRMVPALVADSLGQMVLSLVPDGVNRRQLNSLVV
jgi:hypothetical protein